MIDSFDRIRSADPAAPGTELPDTVLSQDALLVMIDEKAGIMPTQTPLKPVEAPQQRRRGWLVAVAAFAAVIVVVGAVLALRQGGDEPPAEEVTTSTVVELTTEQQAQVDRASEIMDIYNEGDLVRFTNLFQESAGFQGFAITGSHVQRSLAFRMGIGETYTVIECRPLDNVRFEDVVCDMARSDSLSGDVVEESWRMGLADNGKLTMVRVTTAQRPIVVAMAEWIHDAYPEEWSSVLAVDSCNTIDHMDCKASSFDGITKKWRLSAEAAVLMLGLRDEFVAQSGEF